MNQKFSGFCRHSPWVFAAAMLFVSGCGPLTLAGMPFVGQAEALTVMTTDKTLADHVISLSSGKNCSTVRREKGLHYCEEDEPDAKPAVFCYKTLANVTCYDRPDPHAGGYQKVGDNEHNLVKKSPSR